MNNGAHKDVHEGFDLNEIRMGIMNRIPKRILATAYLPLLFDDDPSVFNQKWITEVAGSPFHEVVMTDDADNTIMLIPPLRATTLAPTISGDEMLDSITIYGNTKDTLKNVAENRLTESLEKVNLSIGVSNTTNDSWRAILVECGFEEKLKEYSALAQQTEDQSQKFNGDWEEIPE